MVTGATDGIGRLTALRLSALGATVLVQGRSREKVDTLVAEIDGEGGKAQGLVADLAAFAGVRSLASEVLNTKMVRQGFGNALGPAEAGAEAEEHLATAPTLADITGVCFDRMDQA